MSLLLYQLFVVLGISSGFIGVAPPSTSFGFGLGRRHEAATVCNVKTKSPGGSSRSSSSVSYDRWFPTQLIVEEDFDDNKSLYSIKKEIETDALRLASSLIIRRLAKIGDVDIDNNHNNNTTSTENHAYKMAVGKFVDFCCTPEGEEALESLFQDEIASNEETTTIQGAIVAIQSLLVFGSQCGLTINPEMQERSLLHLRGNQNPKNSSDFISWDKSYTRRLKFENNRTPAMQLLASLQKKRTPRGAFDLLVVLGAWNRHEDLALIRSGFALRFSSSEIEAATMATAREHDPDAMLGIRRDFRAQKLFTIDSASTSEIDDALSVETIEGDDDKKRYRYWIHIADADRWAPRDSRLFKCAQDRGTSIYLPQGSIPMLPSRISSEVMSLRAGVDTCALSLGVELNKDGSIVESSIVVAPSLVRVRYRLTYDEADEMLEEGLAYYEEWELGALFSAALKRRDFRISNGSAEGYVSQIPQYTMSCRADATAPDGIQIALNVQVSHNGGSNQSAVAETGSSAESQPLNEAPVSSASTLVTEMMILAGEAIGRWKMNVESKKRADTKYKLFNAVRLPFRSQPKPDFKSRLREHSILLDLKENNLGYCHAWYNRRFLAPVQITEEVMPHYGLGLGCYVQWTSPIRRFGDLQVHGSVKRFLRREKIFEILDAGSKIPTGITSSDVGFDVSQMQDGWRESASQISNSLDNDIDFKKGSGLLGVARRIQRTSQKYWMLEYLRRKKELDPDASFQALVLGCTNPSRRQYAIYIYELGFECVYISPMEYLQAGDRFQVMIAKVLPRNGQVTFARRI